MVVEKTRIPKNSEVFHKNGIAIKGYDVVAYFKENRSCKGKNQFQATWKGLKWKFENHHHLNLFLAKPEKYEPQFGGYCAFGASQGYKAGIKPTVFEIVENKLFFNFAVYVQKRWKEDQRNKIDAAIAQWDVTKMTRQIKAHPIPIWWKYQFLRLFGKDLFK